MRLRGRFTLWFVLAALLPVSAAAIGTREILSMNYREDFLERANQTQAQAEKIIHRLEVEVAKKVEALSDRNDPFIGGLLQELENVGELSRVQLQLVRQKGAPAAMRLSRLDALYVVGAGDLVIAAPHYRPARDERFPLARQLAQKKVEASYGYLSFLRNDKVESLLVAQSARTAQSGGKSLVVLGGALLDSELLESVRQKGLVDVRVVGANGDTLVPPAQSWGDVATRTLRVPLPDRAGEPIAYLEIGISEHRLEQVLARVTILAAVLGFAALLVMIGLGYFVARRITGHLDDLVSGAQAAARGDLDHKVPVRTGDEISEVAAALNQMMEELSDSKERLVMAERVAAWQEIARRIAHEIKNPLTPIQMAVETLRRTHKKKPESFDAIFDESTNTVLEEASRLKRIVTEFSEFARMPPVEKRECDLNDILRQSLSLYQGTLGIETELGEIPSLVVDKDRMSQVVLNLLENARDALGGAASDPNRPDILVRSSLARGGKVVSVTIEDRGPGISDEVKEKLFTPYFTTKHTQGGSGLGLAIVHRIIAEHGGRISAGNAPHGGARFTIEIPTGTPGA